MRHILIDAYFRVRPRLPLAARMALRHSLAKPLLRRFSGSWPINELASRTPEWWAGWPDGKKFAFVLTHDVEGRKGFNRCRELTEMETRLGFRSSFNFVPEGEYETPRSLRDSLTEQGFEVGVHDLRHDGRLYSSRQSFERHAQRINQYLAEWGVVGFRSGFMLHNLDWLRDLNILYDTSTFDTDPFEPQPDGVNTIFPFWVSRSDALGYIELPLTLPQDSTLFLLLRESGIDTWTRKLDWVAANGGLALVNVHPDYINFHGTKHAGEYGAHLYQDFLEYVAHRYRQQAWFALPKEVAAYVVQVRSRFLPLDSNLSPGIEGIRSRAHWPDYRPRADLSTPNAPATRNFEDSPDWRLQGKRVAMVMFSYFPGDARPRRAAEALVRKGMKVDLICLAEKSEDPKHEVLNGINVSRISMRRRRGSPFTYVFQYSSFLLISTAIVAWRLLTRGYDLVYVHNMPDLLVLSGLIPKVFGTRVILDLHDPMPELMTAIYGFKPNALAVRLLRRLEAWSIALADSVVTVNRSCAKLFTSRSCPVQKMHVVMNSPDEQIFRLCSPHARTGNADTVRKTYVIMYHGSIVERNGLDLAVDAFARLREKIPNAQLRIYGEHTPFLDSVLNSVRDKGLKEAVHYLGPKSLEQLVPAIEECDVGIIPNHRSLFTELNTPTRIFEYLALGKPVIAPGAAGIRDYFDDSSLVFFELGNAEDLARKIEYVHSRPLEVTEIARRGQEIYRQHRWTKESLQLTALVTGLLSTEVAEVDSPGPAPSLGQRARI